MPERRKQQGKRQFPQQEYVEVLIFDSLPRPASAFGHAAIGIDGLVYSRAHELYFKGRLRDYLNSNTAKLKRDVVGIRLSVSAAEKALIRAELERRVQVNGEYSLFSNSCSSNVADVLEMVGILAHDPRYFATPVSPAELMAALGKSLRVVERTLYEKGQRYEGGASGNW